MLESTAIYHTEGSSKERRKTCVESLRLRHNFGAQRVSVPASLMRVVVLTKQEAAEAISRIKGQGHNRTGFDVRLLVLVSFFSRPLLNGGWDHRSAWRLGPRARWSDDWRRRYATLVGQRLAFLLKGQAARPPRPVA